MIDMKGYQNWYNIWIFHQTDYLRDKLNLTHPLKSFEQNFGPAEIRNTHIFEQSRNKVFAECIRNLSMKKVKFL